MPLDERPAVHLVGGTRPEAIKLAPVARALTRAGVLRPQIVATGQHPTMFHQGLRAFGLSPDRDAALDRTTGSQSELLSQLVVALDRGMAAAGPAAVVVQGDTTSAVAAALAAFWRHVPVVHLEAGLRSGDLAAPFPEEANRRLIGQLAALHLAPTRHAGTNLRAENVPDDRVLIIGNTVVDAVRTVARTVPAPTDPALVALEERLTARSRRLVLVTIHRRESWHAPLGRILAAVGRLVERFPDVEVVLPVHPNPAVSAAVRAALGDRDRVVLTDPLPYPDLVGLLARSVLVLSDSGGIQEEAPSLGVPVLVLRDVTERTEAIEAGCARLVGSRTGAIVDTASRLLADEGERTAMAAVANPFGDGRSAARAAQAVAHLLGLRARRPLPFEPRPVVPRPARRGAVRTRRAREGGRR